jgi:hypothetical protein
MLAASVPNAVAMRLMGHTTVKMLDRYRDLVDNLLLGRRRRLGSGSFTFPGP